MPSALYYRWTDAYNKDDLSYYDDREFRNEYTRQDFNRRADMFQRLAEDDVKNVLDSVRNAGRRQIRIVSLGCGPGSDVVGLLRAIEFALYQPSRQAWRAKGLRLDCTGVDAFEWPQSTVEQNLDDLQRRGVLGNIIYNFVQLDMETFAFQCDENGSPLFDFICLSFADAGRNTKLVGAALPTLLSRSGRILVLDNNIWQVRRLTESFGFEFSHFEPSSPFCMQSRGCSDRSLKSVYWTTLDSPYRQFQQKKKELQRQQYVAQSENWNPANVYPYHARETNWCERNCAIL